MYKHGKPRRSYMRRITSSEARAIGAPQSWWIAADGFGEPVLYRGGGSRWQKSPGLVPVEMSEEQLSRVRATLEDFWSRDQNERGALVRGDVAVEIKRMRATLWKLARSPLVPHRLQKEALEAIGRVG